MTPALDPPQGQKALKKQKTSKLTFLAWLASAIVQMSVLESVEDMLMGHVLKDLGLAVL